MTDDPFSFDRSSSPDDCYQDWAAPGSLVASLSTTPYTPVVESVQAVKNRKCYPSPKEKGKMNFMERMRERNSKQARLKTDTGPKSKSRVSQNFTKQENDDPFGQLKCSPTMKKFILSEFEREKVSCNFLPEKQVALALIHRYKTYIASPASKSRLAANSPRKTPPSKKSAKLGRKISKLVKVGKKNPSVGDSGFLEDQMETGAEDTEDIDIQEFDEGDLPVPVRGSFSVSPSPVHLKSTKQLLVRYNSDSDTDNILDSSPGKTVSCSPVRQEMLMRKIAMCGPMLPCLTSTSLDQPGETSVDWQVGGPCADHDQVEHVCGGGACGWCQAMPGPEQLQLCSACSSVAYCDAKCQGDSWPSHKRVCKKMKGAGWGMKLELVSSMMQMARSRKTKRKLVKHPSGREDNIEDPKQDGVTMSKRTVKFDSQPQFEPSQGQDETETEAAVVAQPKSILRKGTVKLQTVLYSPPVKTLEQHLVTVRDGNQEERFLQLREHEGGSSIKRQTSEKLKNKLSEMRNVKLNLSQRLGEISSPHQLPSTSKMILPSLDTSLTCSTPISSPTLVEEVKTLSSIRKSSACRVLARRYQSTPFPHQVDLDSDQELSLTPTGSEKDGSDGLVTRKIDFDEEDKSGDEDKILETSSLEKQPEDADECVARLTSSPVLLSSPVDMFASQESAQSWKEDKPVVGSSEVDILEETKQDGTIHTAENVEADENVHSTDEKLLMSAPKSAKTAASERMVMIPESSSDSSLAEFSPLELFSQEENQDQFMDMFSDPEEKGGDQDEQEQEEDILTTIEDSDFE